MNRLEQRRRSPRSGDPPPRLQHDLQFQQLPAELDSLDVEIALEGDYELFVAAGGASTAIDHMLATMAWVSEVYRTQIGTRITVPFVRVWETSDDPYDENSDIHDALTEFRTYWRDNMGAVDRDLAHLFTSRSFAAFAGVAYVRTLCNLEVGYGLSRTSALGLPGYLVAHEVGHNFGSPHTHSCSWPTGPIDYCATIEGLCYEGGTVSQEGTIMSYCSPKIAEFHPIVADYIRRRAEISGCVESYHHVPTSAADSSFLNDLYDSTGGAGWVNSTNWPNGSPEDRHGVIARNGGIVSLDLRNNNLVGSIPSTIENLTNLVSFRLFNNALVGPLPPSIGTLTRLLELDLAFNQLSGEIPPTFADPAFDGTPLDFDGTMTITSKPDSMLDWVIVSLRSATTAESEISASKRPAVLLANGSVVDTNGTVLGFPGVAPAPYHLVVRPRGHTAILTSDTLDTSDGLGSWDFSEAMVQAYSNSGDPMKALGDGTFGAFACDVNADGLITAPDFNIWNASTTAGETGYVQADCNMDGLVTAPDFNLWNTNTTAGAASQVPD